MIGIYNDNKDLIGIETHDMPAKLSEALLLRGYFFKPLVICPTCQGSGYIDNPKEN